MKDYPPALIDWCFEHGAARSSTAEALIPYCWIGVALNQECDLRRAEVREYRQPVGAPPHDPARDPDPPRGRGARWV